VIRCAPKSGMLLSKLGLHSIVLTPLEITHYVRLDFHTVKYFCTHVTLTSVRVFVNSYCFLS
jgi:hypothetical protein